MKKLKKLKNVINLVLCFAMLISVIQISPQNVYAAKKIKLSKTKVILYVGEKDYLDLYDGKNQVLGLKWTSSNKDVAKVNEIGNIKALKKGKAKITVKYKNKKYVCNVIVKDALKNHISYELIDIGTEHLAINGYKAIKLINNNDIAVKLYVNCKNYDKNGFYIGQNRFGGTVNKNDYIIIPIQYDEYTKLSLGDVYKTNSINIEYDISNPYNDNYYEYRDIVFSNNSKRYMDATCSLLYYNSNNELVFIDKYCGSELYIPAGEKTKMTDRYLLTLKEKYDIQRVEIFLY